MMEFDVTYYVSPGRPSPSERQTFYRRPFPDAITVPELNLDCGKISWIKYMLSLVYSKNLNLDSFDDRFEIFFDVKYGIFRKLIHFLLSQRVKGKDLRGLIGGAIGDQWLSRRSYMRLRHLIERLNELVLDINKIKRDARRRNQFIQLFLTRRIDQWCIGKSFKIKPNDVYGELISPVYAEYHKGKSIRERYDNAVEKASEQIAILLSEQVSANDDQYFPFYSFLTDILGIKQAGDVASLLELRKVGKHTLLLNIGSNLKSSALSLNEEESAFLIYVIYKRSKVSYRAYKLLLSFFVCNFLNKIKGSNDLEYLLRKSSNILSREKKRFRSYFQDIKTTLKKFDLDLDLDFNEVFPDLVNQSLWWELTLFMDSAEKAVRAILDTILAMPKTHIPLSEIRSEIDYINWQDLKFVLDSASKGKYNPLKDENYQLVEFGLIDKEKAQNYIDFISELEIHSSTTGQLDSLEKVLIVLFKQRALTDYGIEFNGFFFTKEEVGRYQYKEGPRIIEVFLKWIRKDLKI